MEVRYLIYLFYAIFIRPSNYGVEKKTRLFCYLNFFNHIYPIIFSHFLYFFFLFFFKKKLFLHENK